MTEFIIDNEDSALWPGSFAKVYLTVPVERNLLTIPSSAMVFQEYGTEVAVVTDDGHIHFKPITVNKFRDAKVEVSEGISESDRIVNNPSAALLDGEKVTIVTPAPGYDLVRGSIPEAKEPSTE